MVGVWDGLNLDRSKLSWELFGLIQTFLSLSKLHPNRRCSAILPLLFANVIFHQFPFTNCIAKSSKLLIIKDCREKTAELEELLWGRKCQTWDSGSTTAASEVFSGWNENHKESLTRRNESSPVHLQTRQLAFDSKCTLQSTSVPGYEIISISWILYFRNFYTISFL